MIDILNTTQLSEIIKKLDQSTQPLWGKMSPQHAIEHLAMTIKISTGKIIVKRYTTLEEAEAIKAKLIYSPIEIPKGVKNPLLTDELAALEHKDMDTAVKELLNEVNYFKEYYSNNPEVLHTQPRMGDLTHNEWFTFHNKHFTHHFKQFGVSN
ncbi:MAG: DUF1569 domain-containing protein [Bacteroidetes bacterium]|nr:DUF1569 domain-containing protein [Bacteroidota bacterium]